MKARRKKMGLLIVVIIVIVVAVYVTTSKDSKKNKIRVETVKEGVREALFIEEDEDHFLYYKETYKEKEYVDEIEKALADYINYVNNEFEKRNTMNHEQLRELREKIFLLYRLDDNKDIWDEKYNSINMLLCGDAIKE